MSVELLLYSLGLAGVGLEKILLRETPSGGPLPRHGGGGIGGWERPEVFLFCSGDPLTVW